MSSKSSIEWTDATWNPVRGCSRVSQGCVNCYAEAVAARFSGSGMPYEGLALMKDGKPRWTGKVELVEKHLADPLRWKKPRRIFVNSMSDLFHEELADSAIGAVFGIMALAPQHTFQILTKRPERAREWFRWIGTNPLFLAKSATDADRERLDDGPAANCVRLAAAAAGERDMRGHLFGPALTSHIKVPVDRRHPWPLPNVWLGVSIEDQETADERIPLLLQTPAAMRFVSYEPALGPVDFSTWLPVETIGGVETEHWINWIIVGGESGPHARPFDIAWARSTVEQCKAAGEACFVKQLGARPVVADGDFGHLGEYVRVHEDSANNEVRFYDRKGGDASEWPEDLRIRQFPKTRTEV